MLVISGGGLVRLFEQRVTLPLRHGEACAMSLFAAPRRMLLIVLGASGPEVTVVLSASLS